MISATLWRSLFLLCLSKKWKFFNFLCFILRMIEIGAKSFPEVFRTKGMAQEVCRLEISYCLFNEYSCLVKER